MQHENACAAWAAYPARRQRDGIRSIRPSENLQTGFQTAFLCLRGCILAQPFFRRPQLACAADSAVCRFMPPPRAL
ncbi:hypothetical protein [Kingella potus]|uniref:hypothetical protein n=1 Tax=Kingella potus TaxID=265175 RepID=UPI001FD418C8|nr:hypothetical protein [Kingella potus]UOP00651.1 hypothetical protein LVJ84_12715 [Kingella potus]